MFRGISAVCVMAAAVTVWPAVRAAQEESGFTPLFNGRDLDGWVNVNCAPETWSVADGMIHSTGKPICELRTARMYENFVIELEYRHQKPGGNAGLFIWGDAITARGQPFVRAIEVQILDGRNSDNYTSHGDVFPIHGARMTPDRPHPNGSSRSLPLERRAKPAGEWNHYRVTANNGTLKLAVNGKEVSGGYDISPRKGYIHLESEGGVVDYRNIRLRELPSAGTLPPDQVAREDEGFLSQYTGTDFRGWQHTTAHEGHWVSKDWVIASAGTAEDAGRELATQKTFRDVAVIADWRWLGGAVSDVMPIRVAGVTWPAEALAAFARKLAVPGGKGSQWHRAEVTKQGSRVTVTIDGETVVQDLAVPGTPSTGPIVLLDRGKPAEFASIFARELTAGR